MRRSRPVIRMSKSTASRGPETSGIAAWRRKTSTAPASSSSSPAVRGCSSWSMCTPTVENVRPGPRPPAEVTPELDQRGGDPTTGTLGVVVNRDVDALGDPEAGRGPAGLGERLRTSGSCWANCAVVVDPAPKEPSPCLTVRASAAGWLAPNQIGGCGVLEGGGGIGAPPGFPKPPP